MTNSYDASDKDAAVPLRDTCITQAHKNGTNESTCTLHYWVQTSALFTTFLITTITAAASLQLHSVV